MLTLTAIAAALALSAPTVVERTPTDDVWVYPHASDPGKDPFLRVWGSEDLAVAPSADEAGNFSYGYLRFDLTGLPKDQKLKSAELVLMHAADPPFDAKLVKKTPLEVRPLTKPFSEKSWNYDLAGEVHPVADKERIFGSAFPDPIPTGKPFPITIDLMKGPGGFAKLVDTATELNIGLTSLISPEDGGARAVYKLYTKEAEREENRPKLRLTFE